jgi:regulator of protease activity HflC (stomatin/prohibitin superfamily)
MMESAFAWIGQIASWIGQWFPRWVILDMTEGAIKYVGGKKIVLCEPGIHFYWPARTKFVQYPIARQTDRLESQTMETMDGKTFIVSATLTYSVNDLTLLLPKTHAPTTNTIDLAMTAVHDVCCSLTWDELQAEQRRKTLKTKLKNAAQDQLSEYGVKVIKLQLNTLARCRVLKISQSTSSEEN